jgi:transcription termination factor NusA
MDLEHFRKLLQQEEGPTLDFKRELYLDKVPRTPDDNKIVGGLDNKRRGELAKDAMALANAFSHWGPERHLIIGVDDDGQPVGIEPSAINEQLISRALEAYCAPTLQFFYKEIQIGDMWFGLITIPDSPLKPHKFSKDIHYVEERETKRGLKRRSVCAYHQDDVWMRIGSHSKKASPEEIIRIKREAELVREVSLHPVPVEMDPESLEGILGKKAPDLFDTIWKLKKQVQEQYVSRFPSHVENPAEHYRTVIERINQLVPLSVMQAMACEEMFVVLGAVQLHEIGMVTDSSDTEMIEAVFDTFHSRTRQIVLQECESLGLSRLEANAIGYLCYGHRGESILDVPESMQIESLPQPIKLQFLTAIFRLAHALDLDQKLAILSRNEGLRYVEGETPLRISVEPSIWELKVECTPHSVQEEELIRRSIESAQKELDRLRIFLHKYGLNYHTVRLNVDSSFYASIVPQPTLTVNPYKGLAAFTESDANLFFGRDEDINILLGKVCSYDLITFLGESGIGKTSLLRAGLTPQLEKLGYTVVYARVYDDPAERLREAVCRYISEARSLEKKSFVDFMLAVSDVNPRIVILLDQAEELFTRVPDETRQRFIDNLAVLASDRRFSTKLVLSLRQDYAHHLFDISKDIPSLYQRERTCRLARLDEKAAREAVAVPLSGTVSIEDQVLDRMVDDLQVGGLYYPPDVQIVGYQLFEKRDKERKNISIDEYEALGGAEGIIGDYFFGLVEDYPTDQKELARNVLKLLVTSYETKNQFTMEEIRRSLKLATGQALPEMMARLVNDRLVSRMPDQRYELVHDYLAAQIRARWITEEELEVKRLKEMLRGWVREWRELGGEGLEHLLDSYRLQQLNEHAYELHPTKKELELIITSAVRYGTEITPWLEQLDSGTAVEMLTQLLEIKRTDIKTRVIEALGMTRSVKAIRYLDFALRDKNRDIQRAAINALRNIPSEKAAIPLQYALMRESSLTRAAPIIYALEMMRTETAIEALQRATIEHPNRRIRSRASETLSRVGTGKPVSILIQSLGSTDDSTRSRAISSLEQVYSDKVFEQLIAALNNEDEQTRIGVLGALEYLDNERSINTFASVAMTDGAASVRAQAVRALVRLRTESAAEPLVRVALEDENFDIREVAFAGLKIIGFEKASEFFLGYLSESDSERVINNASRLARMVGEEIVGILAQGLGREDTKVRKAIIEVAKALGGDAIEIFYKALNDEEREIRRNGAMALARSGSKEAIAYLGNQIGSEEAADALVQVLTDEDSSARKSAAEALGQLGDKRAVAPLIVTLKDGDPVVRRRVAEALGKLGDERAVASLVASLQDEDTFVRRRATTALGQLGSEEAIEPLINALRDQDPTVRQMAAKALEGLKKPVVERLIVNMRDDDPGVRWKVIETLGIKWEMPELVALADEDSSVRQSAAMALGQLGDKRAVIPLIATLKDEDRNVSQSAAEALGKLGDERAVEPLLVVLSEDEDQITRRRAAHALRCLGDKRQIDVLLAMLEDENPKFRREAAKAVGKLKDKRAIDYLLAALEDEDLIVRRRAAQALGQLGDERAVDALLATIEDQEPTLRLTAARVLGKLGDERAVKSLLAAMKDEDPIVCRIAAESYAELYAHIALKQSDDEQTLEPLITLLENENATVRKRAVEALGKLGGRSVEPLINALNHQDPLVRRKVAETLGQIGDKRSVKPLINALRDGDEMVRRRAAEALGELGDERAMVSLTAALEDQDPVVSHTAETALWRLAHDSVTFGAGSDSTSIPIEDLHLSVKVCNSLKQAGITRVGEVLERLAEGDGEMLKIRNFGRQSLDELKRNLQAKGFITEPTNKQKPLIDVFAYYETKIIEGTVKSVKESEVLIDCKIGEAVLPGKEQIPGERYHCGQRLQVYVLGTRKVARATQLIVSRAHRNILRCFLESEVPEVRDGIVEIKSIAREAGSRSKVAVTALQDGIDPIGSCVGMRGARITRIVEELKGEKIDIVQWDPDLAAFVTNALSPARVLSVHLEVDGRVRVANVVVSDDQLSLAIGRDGQNARLAAKLTGCRIDIKGAPLVE